MWKNQGGKSVGLLPGRESLGPLFLMSTTPVFIFILWYTMYHLDGDLGQLLANFQQVRGMMMMMTMGERTAAAWKSSSPSSDAVPIAFSVSLTKPCQRWTCGCTAQEGVGYLWTIIPTPFDPTAWKVILSYMAVELAFMR